MKLTYVAFIFVFLYSNISSGEVTSEFKELLKNFNKNGVRSLSQETLHPDTNNPDLVKLGEKLFFDKILSGNKNISCAACHFPSKGTSDALPLPIGTGGQGLGLKRELKNGHIIPRNAPAAFNMGFESFHTTMWDGRISRKFDQNLQKWILQTPEPTLNGINPSNANILKQLTSISAVQALFPVTSRHEMRGQEGENEIADATDNLMIWDRLTKRLIGSINGTKGGIERYRKLFKKAYPKVKSYDEFNFGHISRALGAYEMFAFRADSSNFDDFLLGDKTALTRSQFRGAQVFAGKGKCLSCHSGSHLTDFKSYSSGLPQLGPGKVALIDQKFGEDLGLEHITNDPQDRYKFKTPSLRNTFYTGPWGHSGAYDKLKDFLLHHTNPEKGMSLFLTTPENYVLAESAHNFSPLVDTSYTRNLARVESSDERLKSLKLNKRERADLFEFLRSLSDLSFYNRSPPPQSVPSGLSVEI